MVWWEVADGAIDLIELFEDTRERGPALGRRWTGEFDTTECARDDVGLAFTLLFALVAGVISLSASGKST